MREKVSTRGLNRTKSARRWVRVFFGICLGVTVVLALLSEMPASRPEVWSQARSEFVVRLPQSAVWQKLQDLRLAHHYVPGVEGVEILTPEAKGVGASRRILQEDGSTLDETVVEWEEGRGFVIRLHSGSEGPPLPFESAKFRYWIEGEEADGTRLSLTISYRPAGGRLGEWVDSAVLNAEMRSSMDGLGASMKDYYESGGDVR